MRRAARYHSLLTLSSMLSLIHWLMALIALKPLHHFLINMNYSKKSATRQMRLFHCLFSSSVSRTPRPEAFWTACFTVREHPSVKRAHAVMGFGCLTQAYFIRRCPDSWKAAEDSAELLWTRDWSWMVTQRLQLILPECSTGKQRKPLIQIRVTAYCGVTSWADSD